MLYKNINIYIIISLSIALSILYYMSICMAFRWQPSSQQQRSHPDGPTSFGGVS